MATLKEVIADSAKFPDTLEIPVADGKITLGEIRQYQQQASAAEAAAQQKRGELDVLAGQVAEVYGRLQQRDAQAPVVAAAPNPGEVDIESRYANDEILGPMWKRLTAAEKKAASLETDRIAKLEQALQFGTRRLLNRELRQEFDSIPNRFEDVDLKAVMDHAAKNRILDEDGVPNVRRAYDDMTASRQVEAREKAAYERGLQEARAQGASGMTPRPNSAAVGPAPGSKSYESLDEAFDAIHGDRDLMANLDAALRTGSIGGLN